MAGPLTDLPLLYFTWHLNLQGAQQPIPFTAHYISTGAIRVSGGSATGNNVY